MNANRIIEAAKNSTTNREVLSRLENMGWSREYAEPGYTTPANGAGIYFSNWNAAGPYDKPGERDNTMGRVANLLEKVGADIQWEDEWTTCSQCGRAVRTQQDSYGWKRSFVEGDGELACLRCVEEDPEPYLEEFEGKSNRAWTLDSIDPAEHGYVLIEDGFENGWHPGQNDNPQEIADKLRAQGIERFLFVVDSVGQFDLGFSVWRKVEEGEEDGKDNAANDVEGLGV